MKKYTIDEKISLIKKYYRKQPIFLDLTFINYEENNIYIVLNYMKKTNSYCLSWFNLDMIEDNNIEKYLSCSYISNNKIKLKK